MTHEFKTVQELRDYLKGDKIILAKKDFVFGVGKYAKHYSTDDITEIIYLLQQKVLSIKDIEIEANKAARISAEVLYITQKDVKKKNLATYKFMISHLRNIKQNVHTCLNVDHHILDLERKIDLLNIVKGGV